MDKTFEETLLEYNQLRREILNVVTASRFTGSDAKNRLLDYAASLIVDAHLIAQSAENNYLFA